MRDYFLHPEARTELLEAIEYYDRQEPGLGTAFLDEVESVIERICTNPETWPRLTAQIQRCRTPRFPYSVLYRLIDDEIEIVAACILNGIRPHGRDAEQKPRNSIT